MKLQSLVSLATLFPFAMGFPYLANFPEHRSLAGLSKDEVRVVMRSFGSMPGAQPLPPPINDTSTKLVNDAAHPFQPLRQGDIRGPCPGLNTLASHGYINRTGVVTPAEIITAVQEGFNMGYHFASFLAYSAFLVDGNHLTNLISIGRNTTTDDQPTTGINTHGSFEGDASITRADSYFGNNFIFREPLFEVLEQAANTIGGGVITVEASAYDRKMRVQDSITRNPQFLYETPRFLGASAESGFAIAMFTSNQTSDSTTPLTLDEARHFFDLHRFPEGFYRRQDPFEFPRVSNLTNRIIDLVGIQPGHNEGAGNYVVNTQDPATFCYFYQKQVNLTAQLYPDPPPELQQAINANLETYYQALSDSSCQQLFPFAM